MDQDQRIPRRAFLVGVAAVGAGAVGLGAARRLAGPDPEPVAGPGLDRLTRAAFAEHLGSAFRICLAGGRPVDVELAEARELPAAGRRPPELRAPFALLFRGRGAAALPQDTYRLEHAALGTLSLFIVPVGRPADGVRYEAIIG